MLKKAASSRRQAIRRSLRARLTLALLGLSFAVLAIASALDIAFNIRSQTRLLRAQQQLMARDSVFELQDFALDRLVLLQGADAVVDLNSASPAQRRQCLERLLNHEPTFRAVFLYDASRRELAQAGTRRFPPRRAPRWTICSPPFAAPSNMWGPCAPTRRRASLWPIWPRPCAAPRAILQA